MHWIQFLLGLSLLCLQASSSPTPPKKTTRSFKIDLVRRSDYLPDGPRALKKAYAKFGIIPTNINYGHFNDFIPLASGLDRDAISKAKQPDETGAVTNTPTAHDVQYLSPVTIGGQQFVMNLDTGSSDTWVFNTQLPESARKGHSSFNPTKSRTFSKMDGSSFNITYGDASFAFGSVGTDTVDIGGATVAKQAIGLPSQVSASFIKDEISDGLVGLGFDKLSTMRPKRQKSFLTNLAADLDEPVFAAQLKKGAPGSYEFGTIDRTKFKGNLTKVPVNSARGFWEFKSSLFKVGNDTQLRQIKLKTPNAIADTGTTLILVDGEMVKAYYEQVKDAKLSTQAGGYIFPCDTTLPALYVSLADTHLAKIPGNLLNFSPVGSDAKTGEELCFGGVQSNMGTGLQIFGDIFFKALFVVFDLRGPCLHVAAHA
ncbi:hypothetical protein UREG_00382 [Uncinocarpus reesii 1704]|uniref:Peptidase A1 domain-containing protein n=1 Tax=Uncinocarpus reesii (strain UAMH 1704) TaxID=336963 RepID=C4JDF6_UNCRE|nr:uncharacterized protein UREG_00382 [Uncinocarpus reesii 1704]EEP75536.1 hypothetical protein UREG_00382 [Uncinocarpus reesii 1704]